MPEVGMTFNHTFHISHNGVALMLDSPSCGCSGKNLLLRVAYFFSALPEGLVALVEYTPFITDALIPPA